MTFSEPTASPWFTTQADTSDRPHKLFVFAHSGAGASWCRGWAEHLPHHQVWAVQLPQRETRYAERMPTDLPTLLAALGQAISPHLTGSYSFFGHSFGALLAYELSQQLAQQQCPPRQVLVSAFRAPHLPNRNPVLFELPDAQLAAALQAYGGTPDALLAHPDMLKTFLPTIRADFRLHDHYQRTHITPLPCPVTTFLGLEDHLTRRDDVRAWQLYTTSRYREVLLPGNHFYIKDYPMLFLQELQVALSSYSTL